MMQIFFPINLSMTFATIGFNFGVLLRLISLQYVMAEPRCSTLTEQNRRMFVKEAHEVSKRNSFQNIPVLISCVLHLNEE